MKNNYIRDFEVALNRGLRHRLDYCFIHTYKPVMDDARIRFFDKMKDYRRWCETNLPGWLGYGKKI